MKRRLRRSLGGLLSGAALLGLVGPPALGQTFSSGSTGVDGPFAPSCSSTPCTVTVPLPPSGVFNFTTIGVPLGVTVTFTRNAANTPAILLAQGGVTLNGTLDVSGGDGSSALGRPGLGGPGGFDGGAGADGVTAAVGGGGLGPGGGAGSGATDASPGGGGYGTAGGGSGGGAPYGAPGLRPMVGGSGGGGGATVIGSQAAGGGGGGGGAIVIASSSSISLNYWQLNYTPQPNVRARGGNGGSGYTGGAGGAGGAILLIAPLIVGDGILDAQGGNPGGGAIGAKGGSGRIRLETSALSYRGQTSPPASNSFPQPVFPAAGQPSLTITSVGGIPAPASPSGSLLAPPDILLPAAAANPIPIGLAARHVPLGTTIQVTATPQSGARSTATSTGLAGTFESSTAAASLTLDLSQTNILTATAIFPFVASAGGGPVHAAGEEITHVRVAAVLGAPTQVTYITRSGREIVQK